MELALATRTVFWRGIIGKGCMAGVCWLSAFVFWIVCVFEEEQPVEFDNEDNMSLKQLVSARDRRPEEKRATRSFVVSRGAPRNWGNVSGLRPRSLPVS
jgi:hypothetical protein